MSAVVVSSCIAELVNSVVVNIALLDRKSDPTSIPCPQSERHLRPYGREDGLHWGQAPKLTSSATSPCEVATATKPQVILLLPASYGSHTWATPLGCILFDRSAGPNCATRSSMDWPR